MKELLTTYSINEILIFLVVLAIAIKAVITFFDWAKDRLRQFFNKENIEAQKDESVDKRLNHLSEQVNHIITKQDEITKSIDNILLGLVMVIDSDKDAIKAYITEKHHYFTEKGWIDYQSLDVLEKRFKHYTDEGGNSFIEDLMEDIRKLPNQPH